MPTEKGYIKKLTVSDQLFDEIQDMMKKLNSNKSIDNLAYQKVKEKVSGKEINIIKFK